ncbi:MAG: hypothetical protein KDD65_09500 [Bacteroidetes bacterium]|nr:hypothetical protein [Bacteroidota bacterium]
MTTQTAAPTWFKVAAGAAVLWTVAGIAAFFMDITMSDEALAALPDAQRALYAERPAWVVGVYGLAVFAGLAGAILLFRRKRLSQTLLAISLAAVIVQMGFVLFGMKAIETMGPSVAVFPSIVVLLGAAMLWLSSFGVRQNWLNA